MIEQLIRLIQVERVDDIPLLLAQLERMQVAALLDKHFPTHGPWAGELAFGEVAVVWLAFMLSEGDHRLNHLETWAAQRLQMLAVCLGVAFLYQPYWIAAAGALAAVIAERFRPTTHPVWDDNWTIIAASLGVMIVLRR